ncbi:MAG: hypothetical protein IKX27_06150 [Oscillospiraceae bacterium]|nr:hypothetical protein [Oscillospiraceae bacterium]MBR4928550.1 hypothetical protein [Oscillospiraceae bacterium]MBR5045675.1 hypothetical protein [Oscillospiraceae bacterium]MBR5071465.1 hypothetical protein [Oscillospiraceae bacterium]
MMRNNMHFNGHHNGFGPGHGFGPAPHRGGFGPMHHTGPGFGPGPGFRSIHRGPRPVRSFWFGPGMYRRPRYYGGPGCLGCFVPFFMFLIIMSAFGFMI